METKEISKKFTRIYKIVNIIFRLYLVFFIIAIIAFSIFFSLNSFDFREMVLEEMHEFAFEDAILEWTENFTKEWYLMYWVLIFFNLLAFVTVILNIYLLYVLKNFCFNLKEWKIFTLENKKTIKKIFIIFTVLFTLIWLIFSGWMISFIALVFMRILYEIFFIWFDYKLKNEKLEEENNLTI